MSLELKFKADFRVNLRMVQDVIIIRYYALIAMNYG
jgi:hypothetical protein